MANARTKITATFWDCGGVLLSNGWDHIARRQVAEHFGLDFDELERHHELPNDAWERGKITVREFLRLSVFYVPRQFTEEEFIARMRAASQVLYPRMIAWLRNLRAERSSASVPGIYLLSNESRELMEYRIQTFDLTGLLDAFIVSSYIGLRKPEPAFFHCALEIFQRTPEECVLIDDREENVAAARKLGLHGICLQTPQQAIAELGQLGVHAA